MHVCYKLLISGKVQGVNFRYNTLQKALHLHVHGWVKNTMDGKVEIHAEGDSTAVNQLIAWCKHGPPAANVMDVAIEKTQPENYTDFTIRR
ncbi:MAG: acylphosphatase [Chitinophagales bacterium]